MERQINWTSGVLDEIDGVYERAEEKEELGKLLEQLERKALAEAKEHCGLLTLSSAGPLDPDAFDRLPEQEKEGVIKALSDFGLAGMNTDLQAGVITVRLGPALQSVLACTVFDLLDRLEKLDGSVSLLKPKWTLELQVPLGGKKGLFQWEMMILQLYPWLSVRETATAELAAGLDAQGGARAKAADAEKAATQRSAADEGKEEREPRAARPENPKEAPKNDGGEKDLEAFLAEMKRYPSFITVLERAEEEFQTCVIREKKFTMKRQGEPLTLEKWDGLSKMEKLNYVMSLGNHAVTVQIIICVDFCEVAANCIALMLLYGAWSGHLKKQMIDAGDGADVTGLTEALELLHGCCSDWECTIAHPVTVRIGGGSAVPGGPSSDAVVSGRQAPSGPPSGEKKEKKPFWKRLFHK